MNTRRQAVGIEGVTRRDRDVVDEAEARRAVAPRVCPGGRVAQKPTAASPASRASTMVRAAPAAAAAAA
jgi:hypothetical protein